MNLQTLQTTWAADLNPLLKNPLNNSNLINSIVLVNGSNTINHQLGRKLQGWMVVGQNASATFYDSQASNATPNLTLILNASGAVKINLIVF